MDYGIPTEGKNIMIKFENHLGSIEIAHSFLINLAGNAATNCFGVAGMATAGTRQGIKHYFFKKKENPEKGVRVRFSKNKLVIELHIIVAYGMNISAVVKSITHKVRFTVEEITGISVASVNVFVDSMQTN